MNKDLKHLLIIGGIILGLLMLFSIASSFLGWQGSGMMGGFGWGGFMAIGAIVMIIFWGFVIWGIVSLIRWLTVSAGNNTPPHGSSALEILAQRYARGEINKEEFEQKKKDLGG